MKVIIDELATIAIMQFDSEAHFKAQIAKGDIKKGLAVLVKLDKIFGTEEKKKILFRNITLWQCRNAL